MLKLIYELIIGLVSYCGEHIKQTYILSCKSWQVAASILLLAQIWPTRTELLHLVQLQTDTVRNWYINKVSHMPLLAVAVITERCLPLFTCSVWGTLVLCDVAVDTYVTWPCRPREQSRDGTTHRVGVKVIDVFDIDPQSLGERLEQGCAVNSWREELLPARSKLVSTEKSLDNAAR